MKRKRIIIITVSFVIAILGIVLFLILRNNGKSKQIYPTLVGQQLFVYSDYASSYNHYRVKALIAGENQMNLVHNMKEDDTEAPYSGSTSIKCAVSTKDESWGGWMFTYGHLAGNSADVLNWGTYPNSGFNLTGAEKLTFRAKGAKGGESVEFFLGGNGHNPDTGSITARYPDSTPKISLGIVELTDEYQEYTIPLEHADLSYLGCGFGFVVSGHYNTGDVEFYLDEISYHFPGSVGELPAPKYTPTIWEIIPLITSICATIIALVNAITALVKTGKDKRTSFEKSV